AHRIETFEPEAFFMRGDLDDRIGGCIDDGLAGPHMLETEFGDDPGARCMLVAEEARQSAAGSESIGQILWKGGYRVREIAPVEHHRHAGDFPVAGWRVLALRCPDAVAPLPDHAITGNRASTANRFCCLGKSEA